MRPAAFAATLALLVATGTGRYARQATAATNANRTQQGLRALRKNRCVRHAAVRQATLMAQREQMFH